jgi:dGTPase
MKIYSTTLSAARLRKSEATGRSIVTESESDRGRVLFCAAFRRLQQKAQVFSMEPNAAVRSRLTHSLEVSQLGRYIADEIGQRLERSGLLTLEEQAALANFVETACLMHDIGNPPFGHFGEAAIQKWFSAEGSDCIKKAIGLKDNGELGSGDPRLIAALADFKEFDGNPQGLRIVARLQWNTDPFGLNLTMTTLATYLKYIRVAGTVSSELFTKKAGYFSTEADVVRSVWTHFGYSKPQRFPLAYVMEAADDIAYCVSDLEDSIEKAIVHEASALAEIEARFLQQDFPNGRDTHLRDAIAKTIAALRTGKRDDGREFTYTDFRTSLNRTIVEYVADRYVQHHREVVTGRLDSLLPRSDPPGAILDVLKTYCRENVYGHESIQRVELAGYTAIRGLLEHCRPLLEASRQRFVAALSYETKDVGGNPIITESKLLKLFPKKYIKVYHHHVAGLGDSDDDKFLEWTARAHLVVDFISGMTDDFAMTTYRTLAGMRL